MAKEGTGQGWRGGGPDRAGGRGGAGRVGLKRGRGR